MGFPVPPFAAQEAELAPSCIPPHAQKPTAAGFPRAADRLSLEIDRPYPPRAYERLTFRFGPCAPTGSRPRCGGCPIRARLFARGPNCAAMKISNKAQQRRVTFLDARARPDVWSEPFVVEP